MGGARNELKAAQQFASTSVLKAGLGDAARAAWNEETSDERHLRLEISECERQRLWHVFGLLCGAQPHRGSFGADELRAVLARLTGRACPQQKLDLMIWEVDEDLDRRVDAREFELMYKRCVEDGSGAEPKALFHLAQFLMFCPEEEGGGFRASVLPEDTYALIYARLDRQLGDDSKRARLDEEVERVFGAEGLRGQVDLGRPLDFESYRRRMTALDLQNRAACKEAQRRKLRDLQKARREE